MSDGPIPEITHEDMSNSGKLAVVDTINRKKEVTFREDPMSIVDEVSDMSFAINNTVQRPTNREVNVARSAGITTGIATAVATYHAEVVTGLLMGWQLSELTKSPDPTIRAVGFGAIGLITASTFLGGKDALKSWKNIATSGARAGIRVGKYVTEATLGAIESAKKKAAFKDWMNSEGILRNRDLRKRDLADAKRMETEGPIKDQILKFKAWREANKNKTTT